MMPTGIYQRSPRKARVIAVCATCGHEQELVPWLAARRRFCSLACRDAHPDTRAMLSRNGKKMLGRPVTWADKISKARTGKRHGRRKTRTRHRPFLRVEYKAWRAAVIERDGRQCYRCGVRSPRKLDVHHIKDWDTHPKLRYAVNNGRVLCAACHRKQHVA